MALYCISRLRSKIDKFRSVSSGFEGLLAGLTGDNLRLIAFLLYAFWISVSLFLGAPAFAKPFLSKKDPFSTVVIPKNKVVVQGYEVPSTLKEPEFSLPKLMELIRQGHGLKSISEVLMAVLLNDQVSR